VLPPPTAKGTLAVILRDTGMLLMLLLLLLLLLLLPIFAAAGGLASICMSGGSCAVLSPPLLKKENHPRLFFRGGGSLAFTGATSGNFMRGSLAAAAPPPPASQSSTCVCPGSCRGGGGVVFLSPLRDRGGGGGVGAGAFAALEIDGRNVSCCCRARFGALVAHVGGGCCWPPAPSVGFKLGGVQGGGVSYRCCCVWCWRMGGLACECAMVLAGGCGSWGFERKGARAQLLLRRQLLPPLPLATVYTVYGGSESANAPPTTSSCPFRTPNPKISNRKSVVFVPSTEKNALGPTAARQWTNVYCC